MTSAKNSKVRANNNNMGGMLEFPIVMPSSLLKLVISSFTHCALQTTETQRTGFYSCVPLGSLLNIQMVFAVDIVFSPL